MIYISDLIITIFLIGMILVTWFYSMKGIKISHEGIKCILDWIEKHEKKNIK